MRRNPIASRHRSRPRTAAGLALAFLVVTAGAGPDRPSPGSTDWLTRPVEAISRRAWAWYRSTPPSDRITWGGLAACATLGLIVASERLARVRRGRVIPAAYLERFHARLVEGKLDWGKGLDYCELNPSPASRVALAAIKRWGRPTPDMERAVALARQLEIDRLRRHVGTLRRVAALAPLIGLLGTLTSAGRALSSLDASADGTAWGPAIGTALAPLTAGVALAILALVAYDGLVGRVESLAGELDRLGAETVDAIAMAASPPVPRAGAVRVEPASAPRSPHVLRGEYSEPTARSLDRDL